MVRKGICCVVMRLLRKNVFELSSRNILTKLKSLAVEINRLATQHVPYAKIMKLDAVGIKVKGP